MKLEAAALALPLGIESREEHYSAIGATRPCDGADHARCARTKLFLLGAGRLLLVLFLLLRRITAHISVLFILSVQEILRGESPSYLKAARHHEIAATIVEIVHFRQTVQPVHQRDNPSLRSSGFRKRRGLPSASQIASAAK